MLNETFLPINLEDVYKANIIFQDDTVCYVEARYNHKDGIDILKIDKSTKIVTDVGKSIPIDK